MREFALEPRWLGLPSAALALLALGLVLRLGWALLHPIDPVDDFLEYDVLARNVAFDGYYGIDDTPGTFRPPAFPFFLAGVYWLFGAGEGVGAATVALFSFGSALLGSLVAYRLLPSPFALISTVLLMLMPSAILYSGVLATEFPSAFLMMAIVLMLTADRPGLPLAAGIGLAEGALLLTRSDLGVAMALGILVVFLAKHEWRARLAPAFPVAVACGVLVLMPWVIRNHNEFGEFIPLSSNAGVTFYSGTLDSGYTVSGPILTDIPPDDEPSAKDRFYFQRGIENVQDAPATWLRFNVERFGQGYATDLRILAWGDAAPFGSLAFHLADAVWHLAALLGLVGLLVAFARYRTVDPVWLGISATLLLATLLKMTFLFDGRHRVPLVPLIVLLAGLGAQFIYESASRSSSNPREG